MGVLAPGSAHTRPSARPPLTLAEIFGAHVCRVNFKIAVKNIKNHALLQKHFGKELRFQVSPGTIIRSASG
jgi:hypothetical protein